MKTTKTIHVSPGIRAFRHENHNSNKNTHNYPKTTYLDGLFW